MVHGSACDGYPAATHSIREVGTRFLEMEKRIFAAIAISIVFLYLWAFFAPRSRSGFEHQDGVWRVTERRFTIDLLGDLSHHLRYDLG